MISLQSSAKQIGAFSSFAFAENTGLVSLQYSPIIIGIPFFMIPAFSDAILASVSPKNCVWSKLMFVMTDRIGEMMFVQSILPPSHTSIMA